MSTMVNRINNTQGKCYLEGLNIITALESMGFETRFVGGCVRDRLLGLEPSDFDIATQANCSQVIKIFSERNYTVVPTGIKYGTVCVRSRQGCAFEVTTLREDWVTNGRHAQVRFGVSFYNDAARRDFTINAIYEDRQGCTYDYFGGIEHLKQKKLVFIGDECKRIQEDYLRILRFFRFLSQFKLSAESSTIKAISINRCGLAQVSRERITQELSKWFANKAIIDSLLLSVKTQTLPIVFPHLKSFNEENLEKLLYQIGAVASSKDLEDKRFEARMVVFHSEIAAKSSSMDQIEKNTIDRLRIHKMSNQLTKMLYWGVVGLLRMPSVNATQAAKMAFIDQSESKGGQCSFLNFFAPVWKIMLAAKESGQTNQKKCLAGLVKTETTKRHLRLKSLPFNTQFILDHSHLKPGKRFGILKNYLYDCFRNEYYSTHQEAIEYIKNFLEEKNM